MKKGICLFLIIALFCASIFAADLSVQVIFTLGLSERGFRYEAFEGTFNTSVNGDKEGGSFNIGYGMKADCNWNGILFNGTLWNSPSDALKFTYGMDAFFNFNDIDNEVFRGYAKVNSSMGNKQLELQMGVINPLRDFTEQKYYAFGECLIGSKNNEIKGDFSALANFSVNDGKFHLSDFNMEAAYLPEGVLSTFNRVLTNDTVGYARYWFQKSVDWAIYDNTLLTGTSWTATGARESRIALRYRYSDDNAPEKNGIFGALVYRNYLVKNDQNDEDHGKKFYLTGIAEVGLRSMKFELGSEYENRSAAEEQFPMYLYSNVKFNAKEDGDKLSFTFPYASIKAENVGSGRTGKVSVEYINNPNNAPRENGVISTLSYSTNVGSAAVNPIFRFGFNKIDEKIKPMFDAMLNTTVSY